MENKELWKETLDLDAPLTIKEKQLKIIEHYGENYQLKRLTEECGELIVAIAKFNRSAQYLSIRKKEPSKELRNLIEEMADVENLIEQIKLDYYLINEGVEKVKKFKINREIDRIEQQYITKL